MLQRLKEKATWRVALMVGKAALAGAVTALVAAGLLDPELVRELAAVLVGAVETQ